MRNTALALSAVLFLAEAGLADVTYEEETTMGGMMSEMLGGDQKSTTRISGDFMRTDNDSDSTIIDVDGEKIYTLDNEKKTYSVATFQEMRERLASALDSIRPRRAQAGQQGTEVTAGADAKVTETGRTATIGGYECKQYLIELSMTMTNEKAQSGSLSTISEMWQAGDVPGMDEIRAFYTKLAEKLGPSAIGGQRLAGGSTSHFADGIERMADHMKKVDGFTMRSVMYLGDAQAAKQEAMGEVLKKGGEGRGVMMKITTETRKIETKDVDPRAFAVPDDYRLAERPRKGSGANPR